MGSGHELKPFKKRAESIPEEGLGTFHSAAVVQAPFPRLSCIAFRFGTGEAAVERHRCEGQKLAAHRFPPAGSSDAAPREEKV